MPIINASGGSGGGSSASFDTKTKIKIVNNTGTTINKGDIVRVRKERYGETIKKNIDDILPITEKGSNGNIQYFISSPLKYNPNKLFCIYFKNDKTPKIVNCCLIDIDTLQINYDTEIYNSTIPNDFLYNSIFAPTYNYTKPRDAFNIEKNTIVTMADYSNRPYLLIFYIDDANRKITINEKDILADLYGYSISSTSKYYDIRYAKKIDSIQNKYMIAMNEIVSSDAYIKILYIKKNEDGTYTKIGSNSNSVYLPHRSGSSYASDLNGFFNVENDLYTYSYSYSQSSSNLYIYQDSFSITYLADSVKITKNTATQLTGTSTTWQVPQRSLSNNIKLDSRHYMYAGTVGSNHGFVITNIDSDNNISIISKLSISDTYQYGTSDTACAYSKNKVSYFYIKNLLLNIIDLNISDDFKTITEKRHLIFSDSNSSELPYINFDDAYDQAHIHIRATVVDSNTSHLYISYYTKGSSSDTLYKYYLIIYHYDTGSYDYIYTVINKEYNLATITNINTGTEYIEGYLSKT